MKPLVAAAVILVALTSGAQAQTPEIDALRARAEQGDANAQFNLGVMYANGRGVPQDDAAAVRWFRLAADQGNAGAQHNLGFMYGTGAGCGHAQRNALGRGDNPLVRGGGNPLVAGRARGSDSGSYVSRGGLMSPIVRCGRREAEALSGWKKIDKCWT